MGRNRLTVAIGLLGALVMGCGTRPETAERLVLVTLDTVRADRVGAYGSPTAETPHLDRLAGESVRFRNAIATMPSTLPSHATILTGDYPPTHGVRANIDFRLDPTVTTVAEVLKKEGFSTAAFLSSLILAHEFGLDQGFDTYDEPPRGDRPQTPSEVERSARETIDATLRWLDGAPKGRWFVWVHLYDPHFPYRPPFPYSARFRERPYEGEIAYMDAELGRLLERLRTDGAWEQTAVVVAGDHGEGLYDHGERFHTFLAYETTLRVPLLIRSPSARPRWVEEPVTLADLTPTLLDLAGAQSSTAMDGISLVPILRSGAPPRRELYFETLAGALSYGWSPLRGIRRGDWKLVDSVEPDLFDLGRDPAESNNLASLESERLGEMRAAVGEITRQRSPVTEEAADSKLDPETAARLSSLGYVSGGLMEPAFEGGPHPKRFADLEAEILEAQGALASQDWRRLEEVCRFILSRDPTNRFALYSLGKALVSGGRPEEAEPYAREVVRLYPSGAMHHDLLGLVQMARGRNREAREIFRNGLERTSGSETLWFHSILSGIELGEEAACAAEIARAVEAFPKAAEIRVLDARCAARAGDDARSVSALREAAKLGFRDFTMIAATRDFRRVVTLPEFRSLAGEASSRRG